MSKEANTADEYHTHSIADVIINSGKVTNNGYIVGKMYDWIWFIGAPTMALFLSVFLLYSPLAEVKLIDDDGHMYDFLDLFLGTFIMAHLFIVFFRSHGNYEIFKLHPIRFIAVPILLLIALTYSRWSFTFISVLAVWWDVYHSSLQSFGLGRIYDMRIGNDTRVGRRLDYLINLLIYLGPILAGASLMDHVNHFYDFQWIGLKSLGEDLPLYIFHHRSSLTWLVVGVGVPFLVYYFYAYWRMYRQGYVFSVNKVVLLGTTAAVSIFCWGFNTFGEAFFVMNFFHAWQYFAIVWAFEKKNITKIFGLSSFRTGRILALVIFVMVAFGYGYWATVYDDTSAFMYAVILAVSILHFWYDSFIWSVQKKQV